MSQLSATAVEAPLILAIDVGTSSTRAALYDHNGRERYDARSQTAYSMTRTADGGVEVAPDLLLDLVASNIDEVLVRARSARVKIHAVGISVFWQSLIGVGPDDRAITPLYNWNDTRPQPASERLRCRADERDIHNRTGCPLHASYWPAKLEWLTGARPSQFAAVRRWMSFGEYLCLRLFGRTACSVSMASATGLFNKDELTWDEELLAILPIEPCQLSAIAAEDDAFADLKSEFADRWPALRDAPWFPAEGDGACNNIGTGCVAPQQIALMIGTSGAMRSMSVAHRIRVPAELWCYRVGRSRSLIGGALSNGGDLVAWLRRTLQLPAPQELEQSLAAMAPREHGLTVLPFLSGERSTGWSAKARATISGLSLTSEPIEILRAALEAVAFRFAAIYEVLVSGVPGPHEIIASGTALLNSPVWMQMMADVLAVPVAASAVAEGSSRGAALLALEKLGAVGNLNEQQAPVEIVFQPDQERHAQYAAARLRHARLYELIVGLKQEARQQSAP